MRERHDYVALEWVRGEIAATLEQAGQALERCVAGSDDPAPLQACLAHVHQVHGSLRMVECTAAAQLCAAVEQLLGELLDGQIAARAEALQALMQVFLQLPVLLERMQQERCEQPTRLAALCLLVQRARLRQPVPQADPASPQPAADLNAQDCSPESPEPVAAALSDTLTNQAPASGDPQLLEIFRDEAEDHLATLDDFLAGCRDDRPQPVTDALQRALHTLRGSARVAGVRPIAELAAPLERLTEEFRHRLAPLDPPAMALLREAGEVLHAGLAQLEQQPQAELPGGAALLERVRRLREQRAGAAASLPTAAACVARLLGDEAAPLLDAEARLARWREQAPQQEERQAMQQALLLLAEQAAAFGLQPLALLAGALGRAHAHAAVAPSSAQADFLALASSAHERLLGMLDQLAAGFEIQPCPECLQALDDWQAAPLIVADPAAGFDAELLEIFREEAEDILDSVGEALARWRADPQAHFALDALQRDLHTLKGGARMAGVAGIADLAHELEALYEGLADGRLHPGSDCQMHLDEAHAQLAELIAALDAGQRLPAPPDLLARLHGLHCGAVQLLPVPATGAASTQPQPQPQPPPRRSTGVLPAPAASPTPPTSTATVPAQPQPVAGEGVPGCDSELLEIFLEEAFDILESAGEALQHCLRDDGRAAALAALQRDLHTLKGGARMAEVVAVGDLAHELESLYEALGDGRLHFEPALGGLLQASHDRLQQMIETLRAGRLPAAAGESLAAIRHWLGLSLSAAVPGCVPAPCNAGAAVPAPDILRHPETVREPAVPADPSLAGRGAALPVATSQATAPALPEALLAQGAPARRAAPEQVRVSAELLEQLVNLAGETSIFRGRIEQQVGDMRATLGEMEATIERVRDQLRRLDTETQAQILSRHQGEGERAGYEDFDPLEMDRYSQLQQLSRALFESASDLLDLKETLGARNRDAETLLQQQGRVNTELQEGLMRTRMVPFERLVPRLRRIVRQVAAELGKQVELEVLNAEGEMDRRILDAMQAPLEHMLRNAVDHGIEAPEQRRQAGKPACGQIRLQLAREGSEICLSLEDDGAGVDVAAVRRKAVERGLLAADSDLGEREVMQFILAAGFSTARQITQISGRGVGMDVVDAGVRQLGGSLEIDSRPGQGTRFLIRLPFTVSVNRALMVQAGDASYAIPLAAVEGIVRLEAAQLQGDALHCEHQGRRYRVLRLDALLAGTDQAVLPAVAGGGALPVVLLRGGEQPTALQVDALSGSREVVVKSLGAQFAAVPGLGGATILGDGRVVVILDLPALLRARRTAAHGQPAAHRPLAEASPLRRPPRVLVVDDSVTVRKVSTRLLERHGMQVRTAKDGIDALARLQEERPDVMLLDIEMPRMDGFEVAGRVRHDPRLHDLPIIMITSRTGTKHRERAETIGVDRYLGKPFQETELLAQIEALVENRH